jgi:hypothetical protein
MLRQNKVLFFVLFLTGSCAFSSINTEQEKLWKELTGTSAIEAKKPVAEASLSSRHLEAGRQAALKKDYITALKHYNTVIVRFQHSPEVSAAYQAKSELYQEMGLADQAALNSKLAEAALKTTK